MMRRTVSRLLIISACVVLITTFVMPVLRVCGDSTEPALKNGDVVIALKGMEFERGDLIGFYYGNHLLIGRYIAGAGRMVDVDSGKPEIGYISEGQIVGKIIFRIWPLDKIGVLSSRR